MNSGPHACVAGLLATDSSPQPRDLLFQEIKYDFNQTIFTSQKKTGPSNRIRVNRKLCPNDYEDLNKRLSNLSVHRINLVNLFKQKLLCLFVYPSFMVGIEPGTLHMFGKHSNTEPFPIPQQQQFSRPGVEAWNYF